MVTAAAVLSFASIRQATVAGQQGFTAAFPPEEFAARRSKVMASIGDAVAILQGTTERRGESPLRQSNQFFYLTGVVEPRALLIIDGRTRRSTLFLTPRTPGRVRAIGPYLDAGDSTARVTGLDAVEPRTRHRAAAGRWGTVWGWKYMTCGTRLPRWSPVTCSQSSRR
jgi:Xaa-Pro aminopeptidase